MADNIGSSLPGAAAAVSPEDRADLANALQQKLQIQEGNQPDVLDTFSPTVKKRVEVLKEIQTQHDELVAKFAEEKAALEAKYLMMYEPLYTKRYEIVNGVVEVEGVDKEEEVNATEVKGVPDFWLNAMKTSEILDEEITERDEGALKYLKDIKWSKVYEPKGFKLEFFFDTNPYFTNTVLTKAYHMLEEDNNPILEKALGTEIEWLPEKNLTQRVKKIKQKKGSEAKPQTITENCESFFNFFNPPVVPEDAEDIDEEAAEELQNLMEQDYDIGSTIRDKIIPDAVLWFTREALEEDYEHEDEDEDEDEDDVDGEEDENHDDENENEEDEDNVDDAEAEEN